MSYLWSKEIRLSNKKWSPQTNKVSSLYNSNIKIGGQVCQALTNEETDFDKSHFKFLGRWITPIPSNTALKEWVTRQFEKDMQVVDAIAANGIVKAWIYQHLVIPRISWFVYTWLGYLLWSRIKCDCSETFKKMVLVYQSQSILGCYSALERILA